MKRAVARYPRGAEWRRWDLHIHTPASFHWQGKRLWQMTPVEQTTSIDNMIDALNKAEPAVFAIMDYWTFDGWFALQHRLKEEGAPKLTKTVLPGIELRLVSPTSYRLNAHVVFSDEVTEQELSDFKSKLEVALIEQPLSSECLRKLAREKLGSDLLRTRGFDAARVMVDDEQAFMAGSACAEISLHSYKDAIGKVPEGKAIGFMPWDTHDGLAKADWKKHYAYVIGLMKSSPIFETRRPDLWAAFVGIRTDENDEWFDAFQAALDNEPRLAVSGSDAHTYARYGDFPSQKTTWIKADPTFLGLMQAIKEPAKRSFIGQLPPKLADIQENKTFYIDGMKVSKVYESTPAECWLHGCELPLNPDLIAIIGNKGSGKSALADVIALLGNSRQKAHFSFLKKDRFRGRSGEPAKHFVGALTWRDGSTEKRNLNDDPDPDKVELVRYIPQGHFEELCNEHVSGRSNAFEKELRSVIFSHADESIRLGALDFDQLIDQQEVVFRDRLGELRRRLKKLNEEIVAIEAQLQPDVRRSLVELLVLKSRQIEELNKIRPQEEPAPTDQLSTEQQAAAEALEKIAVALKEVEQRAAVRSASVSFLARKQRAVNNIRERVRQLEKARRQFEDDTASDLELLNLKVADITAFTVSTQPLDKIASTIPAEQDALNASVARDAEDKAGLQSEQTALRAKLNAPQLVYQQSLKAIEEWSGKLADLIGAENLPETQKGLEMRITQIDALPEKLTERRGARLHMAAEIFDVLDEQRQARARLFEPVQDLIRRNSLIRDEYKLQFQATLNISPDVIADSLFSLIKQQSGEFRGGDESFTAVRKVADRFEMGTRAGILGFIAELNAKVERAAAGADVTSIGIGDALRKGKSANEVYDLLFGLSFLEPRYSLLFQDARIEQLSPGQRGALLLIFYLLVDKGRNPIILDQPEENLDNQTVVSLLVPVLTEAKKRRQIIMVTHNPNLAVVCDAEQVVYSSFDRKSLSTIAYTAGAIENPEINIHVVDVLEGTKPAFDNRGNKYH